MAIGSHTKPNRGVSDEWLTPPEIVRALGEFDLDPCSPTFAPPDFRFASGNNLTARTDGLSVIWWGRVWLNPPYSEIAVWMDRMARHDCGTALVFARTETRWFFKSVWRAATAVLFIEARPWVQSGTRRHGIAGIDGNVGILESATYRI